MIPMHVAAEFWMRLVKTASTYAPPDETGVLEGQFCCPLPEVLQLMSQMVQNEFKTLYAYKTYSNSLRDLSHHAIAEEFDSHGDDELDHADWLMRRMSVLGGALNLPDIPAPPASTDPVDIVKTMIRIEQEGIANWRKLKDMVGESNPMYIKIEEYMATEQEHLDELWQLLPHEARVEAPAGGAMEVVASRDMPFERPSRGHAFVFGPDTMGTYETARRQSDMLRAGAFGGDYFPTSVGPAMSLKQASLRDRLLVKAAALQQPPNALHYLLTRKLASDPNTLQQLQLEQMGMQAEEDNERAYLQSRANAAESQLQQMQQQFEQMQQQVASTQQEAAAKDQQLQQTQQAMQAASDASTQAMMQAVKSQQESIQSKQTASSTLMSHEQLKQTIRELIDPPPPPPAPMSQQGVPVDDPSGGVAGSMETPVATSGQGQMTGASQVGNQEQEGTVQTPPQPQPPKTAGVLRQAFHTGRFMRSMSNV